MYCTETIQSESKVFCQYVDVDYHIDYGHWRPVVVFTIVERISNKQSQTEVLLLNN